MNTPLISVIIPIYNGSKYIEETLQSIAEQTYPAIEVVIIDDGSTDNTAEIVKKHDVTYVYQENKGVSAALNLGVEVAKGDYIASIDADDLWDKNKSTKQMELFQADADLDIAFCHLEQFICPKVDPTEMKLYIPENVKVLEGYSSITMLAKSSVFQRVGLFNTAFSFGDFVEWYSRAKDAGIKSIMHPDIMAYRRIHKSNVGHNTTDARQDYMEIVKARLKRLREQKG